jgi:hypothetical protein
MHHMRTPILFAAAALAAPATAAPQVMPGQWQSTSVVEHMTMPGMPPEALAMMKGRPTTVRYCLTPEEAAADPRKLLNADKSCTVKRFTLNAGTIDAEMQCRTDQGPATISMKGRYAADSYEMTSRMTNGPMTMQSRVTARRLGPCK